MTVSFRERMLSAFAAALVVALLGYALIVGLTVAMPQAEKAAMAMIDIPVPPPPAPPPPHPTARSRNTRAPAKQARSGATRTVSVKPLPKIQTPVTLPVSTFVPQTSLAIAPSSGSGSRSGAGQGAGGEGSGTGGGGDGGGDVPPEQIRGHLDFTDLPADLRGRGVGGTVSVRYEVEVDGRVGACMPTGSSGNAELDQRTCQLIQQRFRFRPSRDRDGTPVRSTIEEDHTWEIDKIPQDDRPDRDASSR